jgi:hypothetical protein
MKIIESIKKRIAKDMTNTLNSKEYHEKCENLRIEERIFDLIFNNDLINNFTSENKSEYCFVLPHKYIKYLYDMKMLEFSKIFGINYICIPVYDIYLVKKELALKMQDKWKSITTELYYYRTPYQPEKEIKLEWELD